MNPLRSMTGFASSKTHFADSELSCEIRSLNSRYLEIYVKLPYAFKDLEDAAKSLIRAKIDRGKISCTVSFTAQDPTMQRLSLNSGSVEMYARLLNQLRTAAGISVPLQVGDFLQFKDLFVPDEQSMLDDQFAQTFEALINDAIAQLDITRGAEGENLRRDLADRLDALEKLTGEIAEMGKGNARSEFEKLYQRLITLVDEGKIDRNRLEMELALISDRVDISEEVVRMGSHIELFRENLRQGSPIGKKLNFILQEMHREANTISTKNTLIEISHRSVTVKEEIERMREQVQNLE